MITNEHNRGDWANNGNSPAPSVAATFLVAAILAALALVACSSDPEVVTVLVERDREVRVVETVIVDRELRVEVPVLETVIVERDVPRTVVVERDRETPVTVVVDRDREVRVTVLVEQTRIVERERIVRQTVVVEATPEPTVETFFGVPIPRAMPTISELPEPRTGSDTVVIATGRQLRGSGVPGDDLPRGTFNKHLEPGDPYRMFTSSSVTENFFLTDSGGNAVYQIIEGWRLVRDRDSLGGEALIFDLKRNVPFHDQWGDFGDLSADDVVWAYNLGNPHLNRDSSGSLDLGILMGAQPLTRVDRHTVRVPLLGLLGHGDASWDTRLFGQSGESSSITSKRAFDEMGEAWARDHVVGTGPYRVEEYSFDTTLRLKAVQNHHRITPAVENIIYEPIGEDSVVVAALRAGRVDVAVVDPDYHASLTEEGFEFVSSGAGRFHGIVFPGNYWQESIYTDDPNDEEEPITARATYPPWGNGLPWISDPDDPRSYGVPRDLSSMERAALVRQAISHAINREWIAEKLFSNAARVNYIYDHDVNDPNYQSHWNVPYDPVLAEELLDRADYPRQYFLDFNGSRFDMPLLFGNLKGVEKISAAIAGMLGEVGINVQLWKDVFRVYEPSLKGRTATVPYMDSGGANHPWDWSFGTYTMCSRNRLNDGFNENIGFEVRELCEWGPETQEEQDKARRIAIRNEIAGFFFEWNPAIGVVVTANVAMVNPKKIASWDMPMSVSGAAIHHPEFLVTVR